jgi:hypothetical protein
MPWAHCSTCCLARQQPSEPGGVVRNPVLEHYVLPWYGRTCYTCTTKSRATKPRLCTNDVTSALPVSLHRRVRTNIAITDGSSFFCLLSVPACMHTNAHVRTVMSQLSDWKRGHICIENHVYVRTKLHRTCVRRNRLSSSANSTSVHEFVRVVVMVARDRLHGMGTSKNDDNQPALCVCLSSLAIAMMSSAIPW